MFRSIELDSWYSLLQAGSALATFVAFLLLVATVLVGRAVNRRDSSRVLAVESDLTKARLEVATQQERAAKAEAALLQMRGRTEPRRLSAEQRKRFVAALGRYSGQRLTVVRLGDAEASQFAEDVISALGTAGWSLAISDVGAVPPRYGLTVFLANGTPGVEARRALAAALMDAGFPVEAKPGDDTEFGSLSAKHGVLQIGLKPIAP